MAPQNALINFTSKLISLLHTRSSNNNLYTVKMFHLLLSAYLTTDVKAAAIFLGMSENEATKYVLQEGWTLDPASQMLTLKKQPVIREQKLNQSKLQRLTEYFFHLEH